MIGGVIKYFRFTWDYALWDISYSNLNMLLATIPETDFDGQSTGEGGKSGKQEYSDGIDSFMTKDGKWL